MEQQTPEPNPMELRAPLLAYSSVFRSHAEITIREGIWYCLDSLLGAMDIQPIFYTQFETLHNRGKYAISIADFVYFPCQQSMLRFSGYLNDLNDFFREMD